MISSIRWDGSTACLAIEGATDTEVFRAYVREVLCPTLRAGDLVIMDNLSPHKNDLTLDLIVQAGASVAFLPAYSPDLNPIEKMWSKVKQFLRSTEARTGEALTAAIAAALRSVTRQDAVNWFASCGYSFIESALVNAISPVTSCAAPNIVDFVGWISATGNCFEGAVITNAGNATQSNWRRSEGCQDTGNNANDFTLGTPTGRYSYTPPVVCNGCIAPLISANPTNLTATSGDDAGFSVSASGTSPTYQWRKGGVAISGATTSVLNFTPAQTNHAGTNPPVNPSDFINPRFANVTVTSGVKFADVVNYQGVPTSLYLDAYEPTGDTNTSRPVIVWLHGGGFRTGSSRTQGYIVTYSTEFAKRGYVCLAVDYRLRAAADMPTQESELPAEQDAASDCNTAFNWIRTNAAAYAINPNWMFVGGGSAGGRTACLFSFHEGPHTNVCAGCTSAILTNGVNLVPPVNWNRSGVIANADLWGSPEPMMRWYALGSNDVPTVIIHGTADATIDYQNSVDLYNGLTNAGVTAELDPLVGFDHTPTSENAQIIPWVANFFAQEWAKRLAPPVIPPSAVTPPQLSSAVLLTNGGFQFSFTNVAAASFTVLCTTNVAFPLSNWIPLGPPTQTAPGQYEFTDPASIGNAVRFYRVRSP